MGHNHREQPPPHGRGGRIPLHVMALRRPGLRSGGPPPEPATEEPPTRITIRIPALASNREMPATASTAARGEMPETDPPDYTERVEPDPVVVLRLDEESPNPEQDQSREERQEIRPEGDRDAPTIEPKTEDGVDGGTRGPPISENIGVAPREEVQCVQITLDPEITETIQRMAREQWELRAEVEGSRHKTLEIRAMVKTHESRLDRVFK